MILVTSANGRTGRHVIAALVAKGLPVRAFVHSEKGLVLRQELGVQEAVVGDLLEPSSLKKAFVDIRKEEGYLRATYELVGPDCMGYRTVAELISRESGKPVEAKQIPIAAFLEHLPPCADNDYAIDMFERMFTYYNRHGLTGNSTVLSYLLGRPATSYAEYIKRELAA